MEKIKIALLGSTGRMGKVICSLMKEADVSSSFELVEEISSKHKPGASELSEKKVQVAIDFSQPDLSLEYAPILAKLKIPHLVATTGFSDEEFKKLQECHQRNVWSFAPNTSFGIHLMKKGISELLKNLSEKGFVAYLYDTHHRFKKDAPSGTAKSLEESIRETDPNLSLEIHAARGGNEVGEHRLVLLGPGEKFEITHQASDRSLFAYGALSLAKALLGKDAKSSHYTVAELFEE